MLILVVLLEVSLRADVAHADEPDRLPTPRELALLVKASRSRYQSLSIEYKTDRFVFDDVNKLENLDASHDRVWREDGDRIYASARESRMENGALAFITSEAWAITPNWSKILLETKGDVPRGWIKRDDLGKQIELNPWTVMWDFGRRDMWDHVNDNNANVHRDKDADFLVVEHAEDHGPRSVYFVNPQYGYLATKIESRGQDGALISVCELDNFQQVEGGLWFPFLCTVHTYTNEPAHYIHKFTVNQANANLDIPDESLDIQFPAGTWIIDEIAGLKYTVDDDAKNPYAENSKIPYLAAGVGGVALAAMVFWLYLRRRNNRNV